MNRLARRRGTVSDEKVGIVRLYKITGGRTRPRHNLSLDTLVGIGTRPERSALALSEESSALVELCRVRQLPIAELAGTTGLHLTAVKVLVSDLIDAGLLIIPVPTPGSERSEIQKLEALAALLRVKFPDAVAKVG
ncbi:DUF742 domain-containing protein [Streptomyces acidiscabies]|uniref:DUF742 domain-containing protein n=1 Tax=Streptomyces acidiscabies TaxID=42234 RepID=UPI00096296C8|nr:DUF742 domain-containing protein [Streptomyces acidiscabies]GAV38299.1 hypothetical protein Saa2_01178 [Streptomyces acidiscabies]